MRLPRSPLLISAIAHVVAIYVLIQIFAMPNPLRRWLERERVEFQVERIGYISLPATAPVSKSGRRGGDDRPPAATPALRPPVPVPSRPVSPVTPSAAPARSSAAPTTEGGSGPLIGGGGPLRGVQPSFHDPRLWTIPDEIVTAPRTSSERVDSVFAERVARARDSVARAADTSPPDDWTVERGGGRYGVSSKGLHLGGVTIPMVPFRPPVGKMDEARRLYAIRAEMVQQSQRRLNEEEFRQAAQRIRERKDREREQQQQERAKQNAAPVGGSER